MFLKKIIATVLSVYLFLGALPLQAQNYFGNNNKYNYSWPNYFNYQPQTKAQKDSIAAEQKRKAVEHNKQLDQRAMLFLGSSAYSGLGYFDRLYIWKKRNPQKNVNTHHSQFGKDAYIDPAWADYRQAVKDYYYTPYRKATPYQVLQEMQSKSKKIGELLKNNPRYIKEVRKAKIKEYGGAVLEGIVIGLLTVATVYTFGASAGAEGALIATWFGASAATTTVVSTATVNFTRAFALVVLGEIFITLGDEITINLYEDLTNRLVKYKCIGNMDHANELIANIKSAIESGDVTANVGKGSKITQSSRWLDESSQKESIIRLYALGVIEAELQYSNDPTKYDLAMLDIINLFSGRTQVCYDESVFTKTVIKDGEKHYVCNQNSVDVGTGRLLERTPELIKALKAINAMDKPSNGSRNLQNHPRGWNMGNGTTVIMPHM